MMTVDSMRSWSFMMTALHGAGTRVSDGGGEERDRG